MIKPQPKSDDRGEGSNPDKFTFAEFLCSSTAVINYVGIILTRAMYIKSRLNCSEILLYFKPISQD